jgi:hypothetical protein
MERFCEKALQAISITLFFNTSALIKEEIRMEISNGEINNVFSVIIIQRVITKTSVGQYGPPPKGRTRCRGGVSILTEE